jgi:ubiquinone/menaquinone biosynthesis C-methylase UbiE
MPRTTPRTTLETVAEASYAIEGGELGKRRLDLVAEIMRPSTLRFLGEVGLGPGQRCLDAGCGGGHVTGDLARIVGSAGKVVGIDFDPDIVELARASAAEEGLDNVEFVVADARTFDGGPFDLVYARFLLSHLSESEQVLAHLSRLVCAGGSVVTEDVDFSGSYCHPAEPAYDRYLELYVEVVAHMGGDATLGRRLPRLMFEAGLKDVTWNVFQPVHAVGPYKQMEILTLERIRPALVHQGLASPEEIDGILLSMRRFAADPTTLVSLPRMVQVRGRVA